MQVIWNLLYHVGAFSRLLFYMVRGLREVRKLPGLVVRSMADIGLGSLPLVAMASVFTGMVASVQTAYQVRDYVPLDFLGAGVAKAIMVELGPVLTALVVAGRVGAGIAAELGTMRVTEQIDALELMAIDPVRFLVLPRVIAGTIAIPLLTVIAEVVALIGSAVISYLVVQVSFTTFFHGVQLFFLPKDLWGGLLKSVVFGFLITFLGCYYGFHAEGGAVGVGRATTRAVVASALAVLMFDYILGSLIYG